MPTSAPQWRVRPAFEVSDVKSGGLKKLRMSVVTRIVYAEPSIDPREPRTRTPPAELAAETGASPTVFEAEPWTNSCSSDGTRKPWRYDANRLIRSFTS